MIKNEALNGTLNKLINNTKNESILWHPLSDNADVLGPILGENKGALFTGFFGENIIESRSYYYIDKNATFFLVAKSDSLTVMVTGSFRLYLYIKLNDSPYSRLLAKTSSEDSEEAKDISVSLRRLHNIIESIDPDYDNKINDFLNDFLNED